MKNLTDEKKRREKEKKKDKQKTASLSNLILLTGRSPKYRNALF